MDNNRQSSSSSVDYEVDCNSVQQVWLVKVPKYISQAWEGAAPRSNLGKLITSGSLDSPDCQMTFMSAAPSASGSQFPVEHRVTVSSMSAQHIMALSQTPDRMAVEGEVTKRVEFRPTASSSYMNLKKSVIREAAKPRRTTMMLDKVPVSYRPRAAVQMDYEIEQRKKKEVKKSRDDKEIVQQKLFGAFERQQFYSIKDLERITDQSTPYLKEILREICNQRRTNPNKNMWELKPEYRLSSQTLC